MFTQWISYPIQPSLISLVHPTWSDPTCTSICPGPIHHKTGQVQDGYEYRIFNHGVGTGISRPDPLPSPPSYLPTGFKTPSDQSKWNKDSTALEFLCHSFTVTSCKAHQTDDYGHQATTPHRSKQLLWMLHHATLWEFHETPSLSGIKSKIFSISESWPDLEGGKTTPFHEKRFGWGIWSNMLRALKGRAKLE